MTQIITHQDIREIKGISLNVNAEKELIPHILEAQEFDLRPLLGEPFYNAIIEDVENNNGVNYDDLLNGTTYQIDGKNYKHSGIKTVLVYHSYARYIGGSQVQSTATGFVKKQIQYSEPATDKTISRMIQQNRSGAQAHWDRVVKFLDENKKDYPLWKCASRRRYKSGLKIKRIG